ncbi:histidinol-phosphate transaminase [Thoreauomyces humboldtii]|nr:histidinol-phosphate transaminase [Thoreauomyces humboldtii]
MYSVCAQVNDVEVASVPLDPKFQLDVEGIQASVDADPTIKVLFLCSPGNPTGTLLNPNDVRSLLEHPRIRTGSIVVVDEAYVDFCPAGSSLAAWVDEYPNLVVTQTLSKSFGLAGIRLGISISSPDIARVFNSTKAPYNISTPTSILASAALAPEGVRGMQGHVASILEGRNALLQGLQDLKEEGLGVGAVIGGNDANFVLVPILDPEGKGPDNDRAFRAYKTMAEERGVVVRFRGSEPGCEGCLRITVGTPDENKVVLETLRKLLQG